MKKIVLIVVLFLLMSFAEQIREVEVSLSKWFHRNPSVFPLKRSTLDILVAIRALESAIDVLPLH